MRYPRDHKTVIRQKIIDTAALRFRSEGIQSVGIANLMADLGLTHGGFYAHFKDKEDLVAAACRHSLGQLADEWRSRFDAAGPDALREAVGAYLAQNDAPLPPAPCPVATLAGELARRDNPSRQAFTDGIEQLLAELRKAMAGKRHVLELSPESLLALMAGAQLLAGTVSDPALARRLAASLQWKEEPLPAR
ncbi:TetR/AcrR family transcriptional regulator [Paludibacterium paludis]|uniref:TetR family transcriptional regulator n=1 Tax=Paludibacterium paludis TaxID=1225769 RepID=A0A918P1Q6_9NEIS|nr:TetR/AcrR family transcriptional regulator [Paludibacterium paludis]GGY12696.1 TetR family transcriptional regulator [Paludibacterium paludis]